MPTISEILMAQGRHAAESRRARAGAWVPFLQYAANLPGQIMADRQGERAGQEAAFDRSQQRAVRGQQLAKGDQELRASTRADEDEQALIAIFASPGILDDTGTVDIRKAVSLAQQQAPRLVPRLMEAAQKHDEGVQKAAVAAATEARAQQEFENKQTDRRQATNQQGVRRLIGESVAARGAAPMSRQEQQTYRGMALQEGVELPAGVLPEPEEEVSMVIKGPNGRPTRVMVPKSRLRNGGVEEYREPAREPAEQFQWAYDPKTEQDVLATPDEIRARGLQKPPTAAGGLGGAAVRLRNARTASALNAVSQLEQLAPERASGLPGIIQGAGQTIAGYAGYNTRARQYNARLQPTAMMMAAAVQGAANLSDNERKAMAEMLGSIGTMDYETQMALLQQAKDMLVNSGADITQLPTGAWVPADRAIRVKPSAQPPRGAGDHTDALLDELLRGGR